MEKTKIMFLISGLHVGGAEMMLYRLTDALKDRYDIMIVSMLPGGPIADMMKQSGLQVQSLHMSSKKDVLALIGLIRLIRTFKPDILHSFMFHANVVGRIVGRMCGVSTVISSIRNTYFGSTPMTRRSRSKFRDALLRWTDRYSDATTIICHLAAQRMINERIVPPEKLHVIYNGIDASPFVCPDEEARVNVRRELGISSGQLMILSVGRLQEQKGHMHSIQAAALLMKAGFDFKWFVAGEGEMREELTAQIGANHLQDRFCLLGLRNDVHRLLWGSDLMVLASNWEGLPGVIIEAMAASTPVVCTDVGGSSELVVPDETGFLCPPQDPDSLFACIFQYASLSPQQQHLMGARGGERAVQLFNLESMVQRHEEIYASYSKSSPESVEHNKDKVLEYR
ncbi:glycosyltransferase [Paenibacillus sp. MER TA 81-3]|uniref:glycosyltransferase n=1 Tax=Paenibacillus sp. MER TA 81-3 TaxID=2939573 RepID=UPI002040D32B|nr:glycosyltransferase [Paenibacillus sp. MER TA 81-3]MCM3338271.1 glycosyltransferase [Paenibacillus sp. MER TA 81-3]